MMKGVWLSSPAAGRRGAGKPPAASSFPGSGPLDLCSSLRPSGPTVAPCSSWSASYSGTPLPVWKKEEGGDQLNPAKFSLLRTAEVVVISLTCSVARFRTSRPIFRSMRLRSASSWRLERMLRTTSSLRRSRSPSWRMSASPRSSRWRNFLSTARGGVAECTETEGEWWVNYSNLHTVKGPEIP